MPGNSSNWGYVIITKINHMETLTCEMLCIFALQYSNIVQIDPD